MILPITPLSQRDHLWANQRLGTTSGATIGSDGCIITDMVMLATYYGHPIFPDVLDNALTDNNLYYDGDLFVNSSISKIFPDIKFDKVVFCEATPAPIADIKAYLDASKPSVVALLNQGVRHYILVVGYDGSTIYCNDPWQGDQVAINDRWGDPAAKILQINFFSGPVPPAASHPSDGPHMDDGQSPQNQPPVVTPPPVPAPIIIPTPPPASNPVAVSLPPADIAPTPPFLDRLKSRKFILAGISGLVTLINSTFHLGITNDQLMIFLIPILAFIIGEALADIVERARGKK